MARSLRTHLRREWIGGAAILFLVATTASAQSRNQFGRAERATAAGDLITLSVQQAISQLPPTAGQSFTYAFDPATDTFEPTEQQGPTVLVSPRTIGEGVFATRLGVSYFRLSEAFDPVFYRVTGKGRTDDEPLFAKFGLELGADVTVVDFGATYGVATWLDLFLDVPVVIVDASASQTFVHAGSTSLLLHENPDFIDSVQGRIDLRRQSLAERGTFNEGTNVGVGRIGLGARTPFYATEDLELGLVTRFSFASPTPGDYSGSDSYAIYPRLVGEFFTNAPAQLYVDVGYEYDFSIAELRRFAWSTGASMPFSRGAIDLGVSGSVYDTPVRWTPDTALGDPVGEGRFREGLDLQLATSGTNTVDNDVVNLLLGGKIQLLDNTLLAGSILVALTSNGIRPDVAGTLSIEVYL